MEELELRPLDGREDGVLMRKISITLEDHEVEALQQLWAKFSSHAALRFLPAAVRSALDKVVHSLNS